MRIVKALIRNVRENTAKAGLTAFLLLFESLLVAGAFRFGNIDYAYVAMLFSVLVFIFFVAGIETLDNVDE